MGARKLCAAGFTWAGFMPPWASEAGVAGLWPGSPANSQHVLKRGH